MPKWTYTLLIIIFFFWALPFHAHAVLQSNLNDPGMKRADWQTRRTINGQATHAGVMDTSCQSSTTNTWLINAVDVGSKVCDNASTSAINVTWDNGPGIGKTATFTLDNSKNTSSLQCTSIRNFLGIGAPFGYKRLYYYPALSQLVVRAKIKNDSFTRACTTGSCSPVCFSDPLRFNPEGHGWVNIVIGVPMYDETNGRNLWVELVVYDTPGWYNTKNGASYNPQDPSFANGTYFYGNSGAEEFYRIYVTHEYVNDHTWLVKGQEHLYDIDFLSIINSIKNSGGWKSTIDWSKVHFSDAYIGTELFGDARARWSVSDFDVLFEEKAPNDTSPKGYFDGKTTTACTVAGWTCDPDKYATSLNVQFFENTTLVNTTPYLANSDSEQAIRDACGGTNFHRFVYTLPSDSPLRDGQSHTLTARAMGVNAQGVETTATALPLSTGADPTIVCTASAGILRGDINKDGHVNIDDLKSAILRFGESGIADLIEVGKSGTIDVFYYAAILTNFGK